MNGVAETPESGAHENAARLQRAALKTEPRHRDVCEWDSCAASLSHMAPAASSGAVPCLTTFIRDRQRMLRSWATLQRHLPADVLKAEEQATLSAIRQLRQLCQEGACHEQG